MLKKRVGCVWLALALLCAVTSAAPGMPDDPVATKAYIEDIFIPSILEKAANAVAARFAEPGRRVRALLDGTGLPNTDGLSGAVVRKALARVTQYAPSPVPVTLKQGTILTVGMGASIQLLSGGAAHRSGALTDLTAGRDHSGALEERHRYICADTDASIKASSDATVLVCGYYRLTLPYVPLYTDLCDALVSMGVVNTYELARDSSRMEMMVIFLILMGVRAESDIYTGYHPFTDVPDWADRNAAYLYQYGYITGTGDNKLSPTQSASVHQLCFLMLKALGYTDGADITFATAPADAVRLGVFTQRELEFLRSDVYTRDTLMYMTYYGLFAAYKGGSERVIDRLIAIGQVTQEAADAAIASVKRVRPS